MIGVWRALAVLAASLGAVTPVRGALLAGPEFQVNTYTTGPQGSPAVAGRADGSFVVVWQSGAQYGYHDAPDDSSSGVFLQRFDETGVRLGAEQHVNTFTTSEQQRPEVSVAGDGSFVVVWESGCAYGTGACTPDGSHRALDAGDAPSRRCKSGKTVGHGRTVVAPGNTANVLLALTKKGVRCLVADPDGALPIDVTVEVRRRKAPLSEVTAARTWRR